MFSERTNWTLNNNQITVLLESLKAKGARIIDLTESNPTRCDFHFPDAKILAALQNKDNGAYRPSSLGNLAAREAIAEYYQQQGYQVLPEQILLTSSTSEAYSFLFRLLTDPDDTVLFPRPSYPLFEYLMGLNDVVADGYLLRYLNTWQLDTEAFENRADNTKAVIVVNPNNPTGSYFSSKEMDALNEFCGEQNAAIIADEVFFDYAFEERPSFKSFAGNTESLTFTLGGISKTLALPQMKLAWIVTTGPAELVQDSLARLEVVADTFLSVNTPSQNALPAWIKLRSEIQKEILARVRTNRDILVKETTSSPCRVLSAQGGWYSVLQLPDSIVEEDFVLKLLKEEQVFTHPGYFFDFSEGPCLVLSLLLNSQDFQEGVKKILRHIPK